MKQLKLKVSTPVLALGLMIALSLTASTGHATSSVKRITVEISGNESAEEARDFAEMLHRLHSRRGIDGAREVAFIPGAELIEELPGLLFGPANWNQTYSRNYPNGDLYFLIGNLDNDWTEREYQKYYSVAKWLVRHGFRAIINPVTFNPDVREAAQNPNTSGIIWSSHGSTDGRIYDSAEQPLPSDVFSTAAGRRLKHFVLGNCYGEATAELYQFPNRAVAHHWTGTTTTEDLFGYLYSDGWNEDLEKDLSINLSLKNTEGL